MKRIAIALCLVAVGSAATQITYNISNAKGAKLLAAFEAHDNSRCVIMIVKNWSIGGIAVQDYIARFDLTYLPGIQTTTIPSTSRNVQDSS